MERKVDEAAVLPAVPHCPLQDTRERYPGWAGAGEINSYRAGSWNPFPCLHAGQISPLQVAAGTETCPTQPSSNLFGWPESSSHPDAQHSPISTLRSRQAGGLGVSHFEARIQTVLGNSTAPDSRCPLCCRVR